MSARAAEQQSDRAAEASRAAPAARRSRLDPALIARVEAFSHRVADVAAALDHDRRPRRITDQVLASGTSVAANVFEADEALSRADFCRTLGIAVKELSETRYWIRFSAARGWVSPERLAGLEDESIQLKRILGAMIARVRHKDRT
ncbi:MAG: four helix bundle protein [Phycisphaerales bacterium]|nr:four helix bundle protein [Phycisphaerales bacterium]